MRADPRDVMCSPVTGRSGMDSVYRMRGMRYGLGMALSSYPVRPECAETHVLYFIVKARTVKVLFALFGHVFGAGDKVTRGLIHNIIIAREAGYTT